MKRLALLLRTKFDFAPDQMIGEFVLTGLMEKLSLRFSAQNPVPSRVLAGISRARQPDGRNVGTGVPVPIMVRAARFVFPVASRQRLRLADVHACEAPLRGPETSRQFSQGHVYATWRCTQSDGRARTDSCLGRTCPARVWPPATIRRLSAVCSRSSTAYRYPFVYPATRGRTFVRDRPLRILPFAFPSLHATRQADE